MKNIFKKKKPIFFNEVRLEIGRILIAEMEKWKSTTGVTTKEFIKLVDKLERLYNK